MKENNCSNCVFGKRCSLRLTANGDKGIVYDCKYFKKKED